MAERVRFHFDPVCPWAWQTARWVHGLEERGEVDVDWRLFSLQLVNERDDNPLADRHAAGTRALRALALVRREAGNDGVARVYRALGTRVHDRDEGMTDEAVRGALSDAGFDRDVVDRALDDDSTMDDVRAEHELAVADVGCFGVPTIVLPSGRGMFGPVLSTPPHGDDAVELWRHVRALIETDGLFELKRERDRKPGR
ncbi:MAG TPA: DsbA family protein [Actinomycetota bacterium]|nr:DsbA family protein [Actinomycetota bacterium]